MTEDQLQKLFQEFRTNNPQLVSDFQIYQGGFTKSAQSMRQRAMAEVDKFNTDGKLNDLKNAIGQLPDIPTE